ncbi:hypothetical protein WDU94_005083 [Cyamophila willieti]
MPHMTFPPDVRVLNKIRAFLKKGDCQHHRSSHKLWRKKRKPIKPPWYTFVANVTLRMKSDQGIPFVVESVVIVSCTRRGPRDWLCLMPGRCHTDETHVIRGGDNNGRLNVSNTLIKLTNYSH